MKVSQAIEYWLGYHKLHSKKKYPQSLPPYRFEIRPEIPRPRAAIPVLRRNPLFPHPPNRRK